MTLVVWDHLYPCEHPANTETRLGRGVYPDTQLWWCEIVGCPGGRKIKLRRVNDLPEYQYDDGDLLWEIRTGPDDRVLVEVAG